MCRLDDSQRELVALGAAMGSNCAPCIQYHIPEARKSGLSTEQISEAIDVADQVRQVPARKVLDTARRLLQQSPCAGPGAAAQPGREEPKQAPAGDSPCCASRA